MLSLTLIGAVAAFGGLASAIPATTPVDPLSLFSRFNSGCEAGGPTSCHNTTAQSNLCCFEHPGGLLLQTQFWDTHPVTGPSDSWTIHGLWPDNCDGSFEEGCDPSRDYDDIAGLLSSQGSEDTLDFMNQYWVDIDGKNEKFWEHEWSTHGTCYSTLQPSCLPEESPEGAEAVAFFNTVVQLFKSLPTYEWLADADITPSTQKTYTLNTLTSALRSAAGVTPAFDCHGKTLNQISWYFNMKGSLVDGEFIPINAPKKGNCPASGLKYPPKSSSRDVSGGDSSLGTSALILQAASYFRSLFMF